MKAVFLGAGFAWLLLLGGGTASAQDFQSPGRGEPPPALKELLSSSAAAGLAKTAPLFWQRTVDFRDRRVAAWLVGASDAATLVGDDGKVIVRAPAGPAGWDGGFVVRVGPEQFALVLTSPAGRRLSSSVSILLLGEEVTPAFSYEGPAAGPRWNSTLYVVDQNDDGVADLLIDRDVYLEGQRTRERLLYRFDEKRGVFREAMAPTEWLAKAIDAARANPATPHAGQYTVTYP